MCNLDTIKKEINTIRTTLDLLINNKKGDLLDNEIISVSQKLDILINKYNEAFKNMKIR
ncbi:aspartyl-phosphate phosphatase Spo0E family protein [Brassicibacter mesophilus]|uniref:aspartyl-phosphate phosphatase Spo0E family protein n=1 Tax=Brassicibacter mesophilus TaxID=745119 RepID=UPI003D1E4C71